MERENDKIQYLLKKYGYHSQSYNISQNDKSYFYSSSGIEGVIAYVVRSNVALAAGDPVCATKDIKQFVSEYKTFCKKNKYRCCFQSVTERFLDALEELGFGMIKTGEEPIFDLSLFSLEGSQFRGLRKNINQAKKKGISIVEYHPLIARDALWEKDMEELSEIWKKFKGSGEFSFLIGTPSLDNPQERKYFLAIQENRVVAFVVCTPIYSREGIYFDVMRRKESTPNGMAQLLFTESFRMLKEQGYKMVTLGTAPLSYEHVQDPDQNKMIKFSLKAAFHRFNYFYKFKPLYQFKKQFGPSTWEGRYLVFYPRYFNPVILYALLKAYDPSSVTKKLLAQINLAFKGINKIKNGSIYFLGNSSGNVIKVMKFTGHKAIKKTKFHIRKIIR